MLTMGVDAPTGVPVAVALDVVGRDLARWHGPTSQRAWAELAAGANELGTPRRWGIEGAWNSGRGLAQHRVAAGDAVYAVNRRWTAPGRRRARQPGTSDRLDARAVALLVFRQAATRPAVAADAETAGLDLLVTERDGAVAAATRVRTQIHPRLLPLDAEYRQ
jgi:hypothetical protein